MTREEAIKRIKVRFDKWALDNEDMKAFNILIPELAESEDERVRKDLMVEIQSWEGIPESKRRNYLAYLEKQKDSDKAIHAVDMIDRYIDERTANAHDMADTNPMKKYYEGVDATLSSISGILQDAYAEKQKEQKPISWTELTWKDIVELEGIINNVHYDFRNGIGQESFGKEVLERFRNKKDYAEVDACEQKPEGWSEEDFEKLVGDLVQDVVANERDAANYGDEKKSTSFFVKKYFERLKRLRPSWSPGEEQMGALKAAMDRNDSIGYNLRQLYEQLKKLM